MTDLLEERMLADAIWAGLTDLLCDVRSEETESTLALAPQVKDLGKMAERLRTRLSKSEKTHTKQTLALYELEPIGVNGALGAVACRWFCSSRCRDEYKQTAKGPVREGFDNEYLPGTVCDSCEGVL